MVSASVKSLVMILALLVVAGVISVGCGKSGGMVNTDSMPGHKLQKYRRYINYNQSPDKSTIVLRNQNDDSNADFGPKDVNFDFKNLR